MDHNSWRGLRNRTQPHLKSRKYTQTGTDGVLYTDMILPVLRLLHDLRAEAVSPRNL